MKAKSIHLLILILGIYPFTFGQGNNAVLFSLCGDTVLTRTSCYCKTPDTLTTYFTVLENKEGYLQLISVFEVREPGKNSIPCADFKLVSPDTISKYQLYNTGFTIQNLSNYRIVSNIEHSEKTKNEKGKKVYQRLIKHDFQLDNQTFFTSTVPDVVKKKNAPIAPPRTKTIFGYVPINKYHFEIIVEQRYVDPISKKVQTIISHEKIGN